MPPSPAVSPTRHLLGPASTQITIHQSRSFALLRMTICVELRSKFKTLHHKGAGFLFGLRQGFLLAPPLPTSLKLRRLKKAKAARGRRRNDNLTIWQYDNFSTPIYFLNPVPTGIKRPMITFSFKPSK